MNNTKFSWDNTKPEFDIESTKNKPLPTFFDFYNLSKDFQNVYEPAEDTFLLIDSLIFDINTWPNSKKNLVSVELGCGNGLVSCCFLDKIRSSEKCSDIKHYCIDVNKDAIDLTGRLIRNYGLDKGVEFVLSDLFSNVSPEEKFDIVIFNPPYVTTDSEEYQRAVDQKDIYASWAGGKEGSETIFKFIDEIKGRLNKDGIIYLLLSHENNYNEIIRRINKDLGLNYKILLKRKAVNEKLAVFKFD